MLALDGGGEVRGRGTTTRGDTGGPAAMRGGGVMTQPQADLGRDALHQLMEYVGKDNDT